jgi:hypothetical protein
LGMTAAQNTCQARITPATGQLPLPHRPDSGKIARFASGLSST